MELKLGDVQTTALIPLAVKANETLRKNARIKDRKAVEIIKALKIDTKPYDKFMSNEGVIARTIMLDRQLKGIIKKSPDIIPNIQFWDIVGEFNAVCFILYDSIFAK